MTFLIFLCTILSYVLLQILQRKWLKDTKYTRAFAFIFNIFAAVISFFLLLSYKLILHKHNFQYITTSSNKLLVVLLTFFAVTIWSIFERFRFYIPANLEASVSATLNTLSTAIAFLLGIILFHDPLTVKATIGLVFIIVANLLLISKLRLTNKRKKALLAFSITTLITLIALVVETFLSKHVDLLIYSQIIWTAEAFFIYIFPAIPKKELMYILHEIGAAKVSILAALNVIGYFLYLFSLKITNLSTANSVFAAIPVLVTVGAIYTLNEKQNRSRKLIAALLAFVGIIFLSN